MINIAINGFGRIGRIFFRQAFEQENINIVAVNDLGDKENLLYLLKYDSVYGKYDKDVSKIKFLQEKDPTKLPWKDLGIDVVIESTGVFETAEKAQSHITAGAKHVIISAPSKDDTTPTATPNVGMQMISKGQITSNASCTTNCVNPVMSVMMETVGIDKAILTTIHANTATQRTVDGESKKDFRYGRAGAWNIIPSTTGAAKATAKVITELSGKFDGISVRVPVITGSLIDVTMITSRPTSVEEVNKAFVDASNNPAWQGILEATEEQLVSSDIIGNPHGAIVDLKMTRVVDGNLVKILAWYDNEWGYCSMLMKHVKEVARLL